jgi:hypothetical protein
VQKPEQHKPFIGRSTKHLLEAKQKSALGTAGNLFNNSIGQAQDAYLDTNNSAL